MSRLRSLARHVARTPLHPQWLLGRRRAPEGLKGIAGKVLDIGAGDRWIEAELPAGARYVSLDYPSTGRDLYGARPEVFADAAALPFPDGTFDAVVCLEVLEHVPDPARVLHEVGRVLKPGARAWLSMPFLYPLHDAPFDFQRYTEHGIRRDARAAGLEVVSLAPGLHALRSAGLLVNLALAGGAASGPAWRTALLAIPVAVAVLSVNLGCFLLSLAWPDWPALTAGHAFELRRP
ncbi:class I SAM-dependent methyltransferase [Arenimonas sp.]|uniref:class I SAM-dependent methyltransferase n=1 Tax=Arenimonas sp. TaxID=1872635 RepID=UPI0025B7AB22|nr:class I SAM-dependent methyltransferase [Arenimonas sp.]